MKVLGLDADVENFDMTLDGQLLPFAVEAKRARRSHLDLPLPTPAPAGVEWIVAYRHWRRGSW